MEWFFVKNLCEILQVAEDEAHTTAVKPHKSIRWPDSLLLSALPFSPEHIASQSITVILYLTSRQSEGDIGTGILSLAQTPARCTLIHQGQSVGILQCDLAIGEAPTKLKKGSNRRAEKLQSLKTALRKRMGKQARNLDLSDVDDVHASDVAEDAEHLRRKTLKLLENARADVEEEEEEDFDSGDELDEGLTGTWMKSFD